MANGVNAPFGLKPNRLATGAKWTGATNQYYIKSGYATSLFTGDPITLLADGTIGIGEVGKPIAGVFQGCFYTPGTNVNSFPVFSPYWPANTQVLNGSPITCLVADDPNIVFEIQVSNSQNLANPSLLQTNRYNNANFAVAGGGNQLKPSNPASGSTMTGLSAYYLDCNSLNAKADDTAAYNLKIIDFTPQPTNGPGIPFNTALVIINNHIFKGGTGTAGTNTTA